MFYQAVDSDLSHIQYNPLGRAFSLPSLLSPMPVTPKAADEDSQSQVERYMINKETFMLPLSLCPFLQYIFD